MSNSQSWDIADDGDLRAEVRVETQYDESMLSTDDLETLVDGAKRLLALEAGVSSFYDDRGIAVALQGIVMAKAKGAVENSPVRVDNIGPNDVTFRTSDGSSLQLGQYESMVQTGLAESNVDEAGPQGLELTNTYLHD